jgi:hypothetical protein
MTDITRGTYGEGRGGEEGKKQKDQTTTRMRENEREGRGEK